MRPPCRFCTAEGFNPKDHSVFKCPRKPPLGKRSTEPPAKKVKFHVMDQINSLTRSEYNEMETAFQQVKDFRAMLTNGDIPAEEEAPNQVLAITAGRAPQPQQQLVPYRPTKASLTLTAVHAQQSGEAKRKAAIRQVAMARRAEGMDGNQRSLTESEPAGESAKVQTCRFGTVDQGWNGMNAEETLQMLIEYEDPADEQLFRRPAVGGGRKQPETTCCPRLSGGLVSFFDDFIFFDNWHTPACGSQNFIVRIERRHGHRLGAGRRVRTFSFRSKINFWHFGSIRRTNSTGIPRCYWRKATETVDRSVIQLDVLVFEGVHAEHRYEVTRI